LPSRRWYLWGVLLALLFPLVAASLASTAPAPATSSASSSSVAASRLQGDLTVFAAASLTDAFKEIGANLQRANPGVKAAFNFGGSPTLRTQLAQGARADIFASADQSNMQGAQRDGTIAGDPRTFAQNKLTLIVPAANPAGIARLQDLGKSGVKLVLAQKDVPVGNYARQSFAKMAQDASFGSGFADQVQKNVVSDEANVKDVVAKVQLGEADAGVVYQTDVTPSVRGAVKMIDIPDQFNVIALYPIAVVKGAPNADGAAAFIDYVLSPAGQGVLAKYGFTVVRAAANG